MNARPRAKLWPRSLAKSLAQLCSVLYAFVSTLQKHRWES